VCQTKLRGARLSGLQARIVREALSRPEGQAQAGLHVEERHGAILELLADDALRFEAETISIEAHGPLQIVYSDSDQRYVCLHKILHVPRRDVSRRPGAYQAYAAAV